MLERVASSSTRASQRNAPVVEKVYLRGASMKATPTTLLRKRLMGKEIMPPTSQLSKPIRSPSTRKMVSTDLSEAPMARMTPISRERSSTLMLMVPVKPKPPTMAIRMAIMVRILIRIPNWLLMFSRFVVMVRVEAIFKPLLLKCLVKAAANCN